MNSLNASCFHSARIGSIVPSCSDYLTQFCTFWFLCIKIALYGCAHDDPYG